MPNINYIKSYCNAIIYLAGESTKFANKMAFYGDMNFPALKKSNSREYSLIKNKDTWYLTTSTNNKSLYELSKNKNKKLYLYFYISKIRNMNQYSASSPSFPLTIILEKESLNLLLEFSPAFEEYADGQYQPNCQYQPLVLNLIYDPLYLGPQLDNITNIK